MLANFASSATNSMNNAGLAFTEGGATMDDSLNKSQSRMIEFGSSMTKVSAAVGTAFAMMSATTAGALGVLINTASTFEDAFADVRKTTDATEDQFFTLSRAIRDMSMEMPMAADEIAGVAAVAGQLGVKVEDIEDFTRVMVMMGTATNMSSEEAATSLAKLMNIMGTSNDDVDRLGATIVDLGNNLATTESDIVNLGQRLAGAGTQVGLSEDQVLSFAGALSSLGLRTEMAGTAFSRVMLEMNSAVIQGGDQLQNFADVAGVSASEFASAFEEDAASAIMSFIEGLGDMSDSGEDVISVLSDLGLGELRVRDALLRASEGSDILNESLDRGAKAWEENTALVDEAEERYSTFSSQLQMLWNRVSEVARIIGTALMEALGGSVAKLSEFMDGVVDLARRFEEAEGPLKNFVVTLMLLTPVILGAISVFAFLVTGIFGAYTAFVMLANTLGLTTGALWAILIGIAGLVAKVIALTTAVIAGAIAIWYYWDEIAAVASRMADAVTDAFQRFMDIVTDTEMTVGEKFDALTGNIRHKLAEAAVIVAERAKEIADSLWNMLPESVQSFIQRGADRVVEIFRSMVDYVRDIFSGDIEKLGEVFAHVIPVIVGYLLGGLPGVLLAAARYVPAIADTFVDDVDQVIDAALQIIEDFLDGLLSGLDTILDVGVQMITALLEGLVSALPHVIEAVSTIILTIVQTLAEYVPMVLEAGVEILLTLLRGIIEGLPKVLEVISQLILAIVAAIAVLLPVLIETGAEILTSLIVGIVKAFPLFVEAGIQAIEALVSALIELLPILVETGIEVLMALIDGILEILPELIETAADLVAFIIETVLDLLPELVELGIDVLDAVIEGIIVTLPHLIAAAALLIWKLLETIDDLIPQIFLAGVEILWALIKGIVSILWELLKAGGNLIYELLAELSTFIPKLYEKGVEFITELISGAMSMLLGVWEAAENVGDAITRGVGSFVGGMIDVGKNLIDGVISGIRDKAGDALDAAKRVGSNLVSGIKSFLSISSPSKVARDEIGAEYMNGILLGMHQGIRDVIRMQKEITEAAMPEDIELQDVNVGKVRGQARNATQQIHAEVNRGDYESRQADNRILGEIRDELKKQKETIIEMDKRVVGRIVEPEVTNRQERKTGDRKKFA